MKYMTPDLIARFRSHDEEIAEQAAEELERRGEEYRSYLKKSQEDLPSAVRTLLGNYALHDARVLTMAADVTAIFSIFLELESPLDPRDKHLQLSYRLAGQGLKMTRHRKLEGDGKPMVWWAYDEIELIAKTPPCCKHSVLLSGGYELEIFFSSLELVRLNFFVDPEQEIERTERAVESLREQCA